MATKSKPKPKAGANGVALPPTEVLTLAEAAAYLRVPEAGLRADAEAGRVPGRRVGGEWRFSRQALIDWLGTAQPPPLNQRQLSAIGAFKDDDTLPAMVEEIYRQRRADPVGGKP